MAKDKKKATARYVADAPSKSFLDMIAPSVVKFNPTTLSAATPSVAYGHCESIRLKLTSRHCCGT